MAKHASNYQFATVPGPRVQRSVFRRDKTRKATLDEGYLYPIYCEEIYPSDTLSMKMTLLLRLATMLFPIMDNVWVDCFFFFVPNRLVWEHWKNFMGERATHNSTTEYSIPSLTGDPFKFSTGSIYDHFGLPTTVVLNESHLNAMPLRMYNLIYNEWFMDENLQDPATVPVDDGPDNINAYTLLKRGKRQDYFTSCLPWPQKGDAVELPLGLTAPVIGDGFAVGFDDSTTSTSHYLPLMAGIGGVGGDFHAGSISADKAQGTDASGDTTYNSNKYLGLSRNPAHSHIYADLTGATAATVNELRQAIAIQQMLEADARGGTRYTEIIQAHFGTRPPDYLLQRPEYLGGYSQRVNVSIVPQTSRGPITGETGATPQANLAAYGQGVSQAGFHKTFVEHGFVIGLLNIRADLTYQNGLHKMWSRETRYDYYDPIFANLGEQAVLKKELNYPDNGTGADEVFGYQERWSELRYANNEIVGQFKSNATGGSLDAWHLAQDLGDAAVSLNATFIQENPPIDRIVADTADPHFLCDMVFQAKHARAMPVRSVPGLRRL